MALTNLSQITTSGIATLTDINLNNITGVAATFTGNVTVGGTLTYDDVTNIDSVGLITARSGIRVLTGTATTALVVEGDARITGILTVGSSSLTLDGTNNVVNVGTALTLGHTQGLQFHTQNLHSQGFEINNVNATGIVTATSGLHVTGGNVGIGTDNPEKSLSILSSQSVMLQLESTSTTARIGFKVPNTSNSPTIGVSDEEDIQFRTGGTERLRITSDGKVGIGSAVPQDELDVHGNIITGGLKLVNNDRGNPTRKIVVGSSSVYHIRLYDPSDTTKLQSVFKVDGTVGIGTDNPQEKLHVSGTSDFVVDTDASGLRFGSYGEYDIALVTGRNTPTGSSRLYIENGDGESLRITSDGKVGIGLTNPTNTLHVSGAGTIARLESSTSTTALRFANSAANDGYIKYISQDLTFTTDDTEKVRITSAGDITASNTQFTTHVHQEYTGFNDGNTVVNYLLVCPTTTTDIRFVGTIMAGRHGAASGVGGGMIDVALIGSSTGVADKVDYNIRSMSTHGTYMGPQGQWCTIDFGGTTYFAIRFSSSAGSMWGATPQHCSFNGYINNCTPVGKNTTDDTLANETILTNERGRTTFQNTRIGLGTVAPYYKFDVRFNNADTALSDGNSGDWGSNGLRLQNNNTTVGSMSLIHFRTGNNADWHIGTKFVGTADSDIVFLQEGVNEKLRIKNNGDIYFTGPDTSSATIAYASNYARLDLRGTNVGASEHYILSYGTGHASADQFHMVNKVGSLIFRTGSSTVERLQITSDGNVGINSTAPYGLFDIRGQTAEDNIFNVWSYDKDSRISLWPSDDHDPDRWRIAFWENNGESNDYPDWSVDGYGRVWQRNNLYIGRSRTWGDAPDSLYPYYGNSGPAILMTNGISGNEGGSYSASLRIRCYQTDTDDRNMFYWAYTGTTSTLDDDQHQKFGVKASGRVQGMRSFYVGRVESDETTPNSVYYGGANGVYAYDTSGEGNARMIGYATPTTSHNSFYAETGTSTANDDVQFKVRSTDGRIYSDYGASVTSGADYAESFEWHDGNPDNEDRVGYSVVLQDGKIRKALDSDNTSLIMGIISAAPAVLGDSADLKWQGRYLKDDFGREVMQDVELIVWNHGQFEPQPDINDTFRMEHCDSSCKVSEIDEKLASGEIKQWVVDQNLRITSQQRVPNPDYNSSNVYVPRSERPEWDPVGLMGKLWLRPNQPTGDRWVKLRDGDNGLTYWLVR